jgi:hypothetical protein
VTRPWQIFGPLSFSFLPREAGNTQYSALSDIRIRVFAWPSRLKESADQLLDRCFSQSLFCVAGSTDD